MHRCRIGKRELMEKHTLHVSIIGGGIGGLATACALQRQGIQVTVFERNPELREIGAGLTLWANGVQVLRHLGLADALAAVSAPLTNFECWSWRGQRLGRMRLDTIERRVGAPSIGIHRADLLRLLAGEVSQGSVHVNADCVGFKPEQGNVISHFADGQQHQTDLLVGADGLYSVIREQLLGKQPPRYSGYTCWRGVALFEERHVSPGISSETWGRGRRFGMLPIGNGRVFWYATYNCPAGGQERAGDRSHRRGGDPAQRYPRSPARAPLGKWAGDPVGRCRSSTHPQPRSRGLSGPGRRPHPRWLPGRPTRASGRLACLRGAPHEAERRHHRAVLSVRQDRSVGAPAALLVA